MTSRFRASEPNSLSPSCWIQIDQISNDFEDTWKRGQRPALEEYVNRLEEPGRALLLQELLSVELDYRRRNQDVIDGEEYRARFPRYADIVRKALKEHLPPQPGTTPNSTRDQASLNAAKESVETALLGIDPRLELAAGTPPMRVGVAIVTGSGPVAADDLYQILRWRLLILSCIQTGIFGLSLAVVLAILQILPPEELAPPPGLYEFVVANRRTLLSLTISFVSAYVLWRRPPRGVGGLRLIELLVVGSVVLVGLDLSVSAVPYGNLEAAGAEPMRIREAFFGRYGNAGGFIWCIILTSYGALIPNTWQRTAVVVSIIATSPLVLFGVYAFWIKPLDPPLALVTLIALAAMNAMSGAIAIFAASRIEIARRQAAEARRLGQYVLKERLGAGGMGEVYRAEHVMLRRPCALKTIRPERAGDPKNLRRFEREVQITATLTHPNTIQIFDYGHAEDGTFYYVMEYLPGLTLEELVKRHGPLPPARAIHFLRQVCAALREAHARGLIHRDIKPGNVMICERGGVQDVAKLLDFGLVLPPVGELDGEKLTQDGTVTGTPAYLSPEQAGGQETLDARSDIYSVGALAYFLLTGQPPFADRSAVKMLAAHLYEEPKPLAIQRPDLPADLEAVILRCLAKDPHARFSAAESLDGALMDCLGAGSWTTSDASAWWSARRAALSELPP